MKTQIPALTQAEEDLRSFDEKAKAERLAYEAKLAAARSLQNECRILREKEDAASSRLSHAREKIGFLEERIKRESKKLLEHLPHYEFSAGFYKAHRSDPLESQAGLYLMSKGEHPYVFAGVSIAGAKAAIELFKSALPGLEAEASTAKSALDAFIQKHGSL